MYNVPGRLIKVPFRAGSAWEGVQTGAYAVFFSFKDYLQWFSHKKPKSVIDK